MTAKRQVKSIIRRMVKRDQAAVDAPPVHEAWIRTPEGAAEAALLAGAYADLDPEVQEWIAETAARTGADSAAPLVAAALQDPGCKAGVLTGVWYASRFGADTGYRKALAPLLMRWTQPPGTPASDYAITVLPQFDIRLASEALLVPQFLEGAIPTVLHVIRAFTDAGHAVPLAVVRGLFARLESSLGMGGEDNLDTSALKTCLSALAFHRPDEAIERVDMLIARCPSLSDSLSEVFLHAVDITDIYYRLCDYADEPARFAMLPHPARLYFAASYFLSDFENGGLGQAFGNSTGDYAHLAREGFAAAGDSVLSRLLDRAFALFGSEGPPLDRAERVRQMEAMQPDFWDRTNAWSDEEFAAPGRLSSRYLLDRYAAKHADVLRPLLTK